MREGRASVGMKLVNLGVVIAMVAGCGGGSSAGPDAAGPVDAGGRADAPDPGADAGSGSGSGSGAGSVPEILAGPNLGSVRDFAVGPDAIYPLVLINGHYALVRCPLTGCSDTPQVLGQVGNTTNGRGVAIAGSGVFWLSDPETIMRANLDGTGVAPRYQFLSGQVEFPLRASGSTLYFSYQPDTFKPVVMALDAEGTAAPAPLAATQAADVGFSDRLDVVADKLVFWHDQQGTDPHAIQVLDLTANTTTTVGSTVDISSAGFALATSGVAWVEEQSSTADVRACLFGATCDATTAGPPTFVALAAAGDDVFFGGRTSDNRATIVSCDLPSLAARTCVPRVLADPATAVDLLQLRALEVTADAIYAGTDPEGGGALWRIAR